MTFDEWFDEQYPESEFSDSMKIIRLSLKEVAEKSWKFAYSKGYRNGDQDASDYYQLREEW